MVHDEDDADETIRIPFRINACLLESLREEYPTVSSDQTRVRIALHNHLDRREPATPGDVNHEVRHAFKDLMDDIYPQDVMVRLDQLERKIDELE